MSAIRTIICVMFALVLGFWSWAQPPSASAADQPSKRQLKQWLKQYPDADSNGDGVLTVDEAQRYRDKQRSRRPAKQPPADYDFQTSFPFATMSDGVKIALAIGYPHGFDAADTGRKWPAVLEMMGYPGSTVPQSPGEFGNKYVTVRASVRGAGASGGTIRAISRRTGMDGYEIIENWIVKRPWSNGKVALQGHSWGGLTGFMIAATNPPHLKAVAVSGLLDDIYRDIGRIGGIRNSGFPVDWMVNLYKPTGPFDSGEAAMQARGLSQEAYQRIVDSRPPWDITRSVLWRSLITLEATPELDAASPGTFAAGVRAPIHIMHAYQDEQTGPSGLWLWKYIPDDVPKRLVLSNGGHGTVRRFIRERRAWLDYWTLGGAPEMGREFRDPGRRVQVYFETLGDSNGTNQPLVAADFPLPQTRWTRYYLSDKNKLNRERPDTLDQGRGSSDSYTVAVGRPDSELDGVHYLHTFDQPTAICGPVAVTLWLKCTTIDTDLFVAVGDEDSSGKLQLLQRGLLRASHRTLDTKKSLIALIDGEQTLVRPRHTHRDLQPLVPGKPYKLEIEVFPVGHVFRAGHQLALWISQPPLGDPVTRHRDGRPSYKYDSAMPPGRVAVLHSSEYRSSVLLPVLPALPPVGKTPPAPGAQAGVFLK